jgi:large subunit ribosomal protein L6
MSRLGKQIIAIPEKTTITMDGNKVTVKGPLGELSRVFRDSEITISIADTVTLVPKRNDVFSRALWGTYASHLKNMLEGVNKAYEKKLVLEGVGFKSDVQGTTLNLALGFSHPVKMLIPAGLNVKAEKNVITISGIDKEMVGQFASQVRGMKKPEPYKGKGFRYEGEVIRRKQGKKSA